MRVGSAPLSRNLGLNSRTISAVMIRMVRSSSYLVLIIQFEPGTGNEAQSGVQGVTSVLTEVET